MIFAVVVTTVVVIVVKAVVSVRAIRCRLAV